MRKNKPIIPFEAIGLIPSTKIEDGVVYSMAKVWFRINIPNETFEVGSGCGGSLYFESHLMYLDCAKKSKDTIEKGYFDVAKWYRPRFLHSWQKRKTKKGKSVNKKHGHNRRRHNKSRISQ